MSSNAADCFAAGPQGPLQGRPLRRAQADRLARSRWTSSRTARSSHKDVPMRNAMNEVLRDRVHQGLPARRRSLEQDDQGRGHRLRAARCRRSQVPPPDRHVVRPRASTPDGQLIDGRRVGRSAAASGCRTTPTRTYIKSLMKPVLRARQDGELDRAADARASTACRATSSTSGSSRLARAASRPGDTARAARSRR